MSKEMGFEALLNMSKIVLEKRVNGLPELSTAARKGRPATTLEIGHERADMKSNDG
jgi:hypothetical protein